MVPRGRLQHGVRSDSILLASSRLIRDTEELYGEKTDSRGPARGGRVSPAGARRRGGRAAPPGPRGGGARRGRWTSPWQAASGPPRPARKRTGRSERSAAEA